MEDRKPQHPGMIDAARKSLGEPLYAYARIARRILLDAGWTEEKVADYVRRFHSVTEPHENWPPAA